MRARRSKLDEPIPYRITARGRAYLQRLKDIASYRELRDVLTRRLGQVNQRLAELEQCGPKKKLNRSKRRERSK